MAKAQQQELFNLVTGEPIPINQSAARMKVVLTGGINPDCAGEVHGLSDVDIGDRWAATALQGSTHLPSTVAHEMGHVLLRTTIHDDAGSKNLMQTAGDGWQIPGCDTWASGAFGRPFNCQADVVAERFGTCAAMRANATSFGGNPDLSADAPYSLDPNCDGIACGFYDPKRWGVHRWSGPESATFTTTNTTEGTHAMVLPEGYTQFISPVFNTADVMDVGDKLSVDVFIPGNVPNPWWVGSVALAFENPPTGTTAFLGSLELTPLPRGQWATFEVSVPQNVREVLLGDFPAARFTIETTTASGEGDAVLLDNLRFTGTLERRTVFHREGSQGTPVSSSPLFSFEDSAEWSSQHTELSSSTVRALSGFASLAVPVDGWTVVERADPSRHQSSPSSRRKCPSTSSSLIHNQISGG